MTRKKGIKTEQPAVLAKETADVSSDAFPIAGIGASAGVNNILKMAWEMKKALQESEEKLRLALGSAAITDD